MIIAIIPAKGDSRRVPNKNMQLLLGKPLLQHAIEYAKNSNKLSKIFVSTDDSNIAEFSNSKGIEVIMRSKNLGGETPLIDVLKHALCEVLHPDIHTVVCIQPDHPDRIITLDQVIEKYNDENLDCLNSKDAKGKGNGAHSIMKAKGILENNFKNIGFIVDDCTNIHYEADLLLAEKRLLSRKLT